MNEYINYIRAPRPVLEESLPTYVEDELDKVEKALTFNLTGRKGAATLSSGTVAVSLYPEEPDDTYEVFLSTGVNETLYVTSKTTSGFTINSSNGSSTADVAWLVVR
ncbi:hypothetical protein BSL82_03420 [Tardibacter chloracetimidivorans]|uniref:Uncharacterized protein n=1 Tax=Tardibacter chloracetimidivorans TaxID=1921510 RepID=A0A1L3ZS61_9SPHN|nr:hypothetical protein [Tardibacter chloracetimidivorans]API58467.1 hypothetical protein BSL82_03420 [Tardibacter chloracetimidivorans]